MIKQMAKSTPKIAHGSQNGNQTQNHVSQAGLLVSLIIKNTSHVIKPIAPIGNWSDAVTFVGLLPSYLLIIFSPSIFRLSANLVIFWRLLYSLSRSRYNPVHARFLYSLLYSLLKHSHSLCHQREITELEY